MLGKGYLDLYQPITERSQAPPDNNARQRDACALLTGVPDRRPTAPPAAGVKAGRWPPEGLGLDPSRTTPCSRSGNTHHQHNSGKLPIDREEPYVDGCTITTL